jgi:hypothetical protein
MTETGAYPPFSFHQQMTAFGIIRSTVERSVRVETRPYHGEHQAYDFHHWPACQAGFLNTSLHQ